MTASIREFRKNPHHKVGGPYSAAFRAARQLGWSFRSAGTVVNDLGHAISLTHVHTAGLEKMICSSTARYRAGLVSNHLYASGAGTDYERKSLKLHGLDISYMSSMCAKATLGYPVNMVDAIIRDRWPTGRTFTNGSSILSLTFVPYADQAPSTMYIIEYPSALVLRFCVVQPLVSISVILCIVTAGTHI